jgi:hypothetical protein
LTPVHNRFPLFPTRGNASVINSVDKVSGSRRAAVLHIIYLDIAQLLIIQFAMDFNEDFFEQEGFLLRPTFLLQPL